MLTLLGSALTLLWISRLGYGNVNADPRYTLLWNGPLQEMLGTRPLQDMLWNGPLQEVLWNGPLQDMLWNGPLQEMLGNARSARPTPDTFCPASRRTGVPCKLRLVPSKLRLA